VDPNRAGLIIAIAAIGVAFWMFTFERYDPVTQRWFDGFGRELTLNLPRPMGTEKSPGILWNVVDTVVGISIFSICAGLLALGHRMRRPEPKHD